MPRRAYIGGSVTHTPNIGYPGTYVYTPFASGFPAGNFSSEWGTHPVKTYAVGAGYLSGSGHAQIIAGGVDIMAVVVDSLGAPLEMRIWDDAGFITYGRNENDNTGNVYWSGGGIEWPGAVLPGWFDWATVPAAPSMNVVTPGPTPGSLHIEFQGSPDDGGMPIQAWQLQYAINSSFVGAETIFSSGTSDITGLLTGETYYARARGGNNVGWGAWSNVRSSATKSTGGRRWTGSAFTPMTTGRRWGGSSWVNLSTRKRWTGSAWVNLTN